MPLKQAAMLMADVFPDTHYFEMDSKTVGAKFAIWVNVPFGYKPDQQYPVIYLPDGNMALLHSARLLPDPIFPLTPFISVCIGYTGKDAEQFLAVRARDLLPPGEPLLEGTEQGIAGLVAGGVLDQEGADFYLYNLQNPRGDRFLSFIEHELHPAIVAHYPVDDARAGLFGYSYGGLFATYASICGSGLLRRIGAGSPGILKESRVFELYEEKRNSDADFFPRSLHLTVASAEITAPSPYQTLVGQGSAKFIARVGQAPIDGFDFSARIIDHESHASCWSPSWFSFLRSQYGANGGHSQ
jgi:uncharacterized protein